MSKERESNAVHRTMWRKLVRSINDLETEIEQKEKQLEERLSKGLLRVDPDGSVHQIQCENCARLEAEVVKAQFLLEDALLVNSLDWMTYVNRYDIMPDKMGDRADFEDKSYKHWRDRAIAYLAEREKEEK